VAGGLGVGCMARQGLGLGVGTIRLVVTFFYYMFFLGFNGAFI
jgi:hypothetical protein